MSQVSKLRDLTERLFAEIKSYPLEEWVLAQRDAGKSWRQIERDLRDEVGIEVTNVTLISWYGSKAAA